MTWRHVISLEEAAKQISLREEGIYEDPRNSGDPEHFELETEEAQKLKTKIRRLYDIANVLQSIGLIEKTNQTYNKKPAFRWIGIHGVHAFVRELGDERKSNGLESPPTFELPKQALGLKRTYSENASAANSTLEVGEFSKKQPSVNESISATTRDSITSRFPRLPDEDKENIAASSNNEFKRDRDLNKRELKQQAKVLFDAPRSALPKFSTYSLLRNPPAP